MKVSQIITRVLISSFLITSISSCGLQSSYIKMEESRSPISPDNVNVFDNTTKPTDYVVLGKINVHAIQDAVGTKWWQPELRKQAAAKGANGVIIEQMSSTGGSGRGYLDIIASAIVYVQNTPIESSASLSKYQHLKELKELLDMGGITEEEYNIEKKKILAE